MRTRNGRCATRDSALAALPTLLTVCLILCLILSRKLSVWCCVLGGLVYASRTRLILLLLLLLRTAVPIGVVPVVARSKRDLLPSL